MTRKSNATKQVLAFSQISQLIGVASPVHPSESKSLYQNGLQAAITDLGAYSRLQIYLAEKSTSACGGSVDTSHTAMSKRIEQIAKVDEQIALRIKTLRGLQSAYEALVNRNVHIERLQMKNGLLPVPKTLY